MNVDKRCPVCSSQECYPHGYTGPLPRCLGGQGIDAPPAERVPVGRRHRRPAPVTPPEEDPC